MTKSKILIATVGLVTLTLLTVAACGSVSATSTSEPTDTPERTTEPPGPVGGALQPDDTVQPDETGAALGSGGPNSGLPGIIPGDSGPAVGQAPTEMLAGTSRTAPLIQFSTNQQVGIWVSGRGEVTAVPDLAILNLGVEARARIVEEAQRQAAQAMDRIIQTLRDGGIEDRDMHTRRFNIFPEYERRVLVGYRVSNQVSVKIRDVGSVGSIVDGVAKAGGDLTRIQGINFTVEDTQALESQAREKAIQDLMAKAKQFADLTGVQLGKLVFLSESGGFVPRLETFTQRACAEAAPAQAPTPIIEGELKLTTTVQGVYAIE